MSRNSSRWRTSGVRIIRPDELDDATAQTLGMHRRAAVTTKRTGATKLWAGTVTIEPAAKTGAHHHGDLESVIYAVRGARIPPASSGAQCSRHRHSRRPQRRQQSAGQAHCERPYDGDLSKLRRDIELKAEAEGADRHAVEEDPGECGSEQRAR